MKGLHAANERDVSHVMYSYGARNAGNPELHKAFEKWLMDVDPKKLDHPSLFNILYYMLFRESTNEELWKKLVARVLEIDDLLPLIYYRPFKAARMYLKGLYKEWDADILD